MTLEELMQGEDVRLDSESTMTMEEIYARIKLLYEEGSTSCVFRHRGVPDEDEISDRQVDQLRADGYYVVWNRACLWYEVSGW